MDIWNGPSQSPHLWIEPMSSINKPGNEQTNGQIPGNSGVMLLFSLIVLWQRAEHMKGGWKQTKEREMKVGWFKKTYSTKRLQRSSLVKGSQAYNWLALGPCQTEVLHDLTLNNPLYLLIPMGFQTSSFMKLCLNGSNENSWKKCGDLRCFFHSIVQKIVMVEGRSLNLINSV